MTIRVLLAAAVLAAAAPAADAQEDATKVGIVEHLGETIPLDTEVYDEEGNLVTLRSLVDRPTILMFVYYKCPGICTPLLTEVAGIVDKMKLEPGTDYRILTVSFDPEEKPELARDKKQTYLGQVERTVDPAGWRFLTAEPEAIEALTRATGFRFTKEQGEWVHSGALIALSPSGTITRYLVGIRHLPFDVTMALYEAHEGRTGPTIAKVMKFCFTYDPEGRRYAFDIVRMGGLVVVGLAGVFAAVVLFRPKAKQRSA